VTPTTPPAGVDQPVENPELSAALQQFVTNRDSRAEQELAQQLRRAVFLVPMLADELRIANGVEPGSQVMEPGSRIKLISCVDAAGAQHLPLFTDWPAIRAWTEQQVSTLVIPAAQAWEMVLGNDQYAGAVVNPGAGAHALPLTKQTIAFLRGDVQLEGADEVEEALEDLVEEPSDENRLDLYVALQTSLLYLAAQPAPSEPGDAPRADEARQIQMLVMPAPDGGTLLIAFTSVEEVRKTRPADPAVGVRALDVLRAVVGGKHAGVVLNPSSHRVVIPKIDAEVIVSDAASRAPA
jgi:hypothetical protein